MLQIVFHYSAEITGWLMVPIALSSVLLKTFIARILTVFGYKKTLIYSACCMTIIIATMSLLNQHSPIWQIILILIFYGATMSVIFTSINTLTICDLEYHNASSGSTMLSVIQQVGIGIGITLSSVIVNLYRTFLPETPQQLQQSFSYTFLTSVSFGIALIVILFRLRDNDGEHLQKHNVENKNGSA